MQLIGESQGSDASSIQWVQEKVLYKFVFGRSKIRLSFLISSSRSIPKVVTAVKEDFFASKLNFKSVRVSLIGHLFLNLVDILSAPIKFGRYGQQITILFESS